ncbi:30S ribosome-binding factor RbfA [Mycoplasma phocimorsus]|uniref:30S ribosome-binding factor RbfA n=1 Tax=Mycoplasma phocimorsus TaxID=3045839 RepID=UPI0024BF4AD5|nr:30S ribosome-binding factor RbfA [Mycoplasma phocimorsus]MDJ1648531.1 30S ribosome-binding factor RbfA [Mycoplasma phocimorsus]
MKNIATARREEQLKQVLGIIIENLDDKDLIFPSIIDIRLSNDLSVAKVFVSFVKKPNKGLEKLISATNYIKKQLTLYLNWKKIPNIIFQLDEVMEEGLKIDMIIKNIQSEEKPNIQEDNQKTK